ncbi:hypothetical protein N7462_008986 [Penicillium macrosclerotiorum]|uniref:uncharacterized protein n=1 Tax=Penicillium macrosclerotiorum TaxID=303699 RepID=UPI0025472827|nr:uncharacterized protein N7462_008986 [Penicillium macrosclerotiorum]KAJ5676089.1 hypothetical protein N7462_008986 [Penicillium macrosclerotiorum]
MSKVRWTAAADQTLLLKIIETHELSVDTAKVAAAWPDDAEAKPTPRAIKERISKIRELSKTSGLGITSNTSTPSKRGRGGRKAASGSPTSARKRKREKSPESKPKTEEDFEHEQLVVDDNGHETADEISPAAISKAPLTPRGPGGKIGEDSEAEVSGNRQKEDDGPENDI